MKRQINSCVHSNFVLSHHCKRYGYQGAGSMKPLLFDPSGNGNNTILGIFSSEHGGRAYGINNGGRIVGGNGNGEECSAWLFDITGREDNLYPGQGEDASISGHYLAQILSTMKAGWLDEAIMGLIFLLPSPNPPASCYSALMSRKER